MDWTSIEAGLPQRGVPLILTLEFDGEPDRRRLEYPAYYAFSPAEDRHAWYGAGGREISRCWNVAAWMPVPRPYEGGGNDDGILKGSGRIG